MKTFSENVLSVWKDKGRKWLKSLPFLVESLAEQWGLENFKPLQNFSYHYVLTAALKNTNDQVILKLGCDHKAIAQEMLALRLYDGQGCVRLINVDLKMGALLLERVNPGVPLKSFFPQKDALAVEHVANVMKRLHSVPLKGSSEFPTIAKWLRSLNRVKKEEIPPQHLQKAKSLSAVLLET